MKTLRQELVERVVARMQGISVANGCETDFQSVEEWPTRYQEDELTAGPRLGVCDLTNDPATDGQHAERQENRIRFQVRIFVSSATRVTDLRKMIGDVVAAVRTDMRWGKLALYTEPGQDGFIVPQESLEVAGAAVEFTVVVQSGRFNPYE